MDQVGATLRALRPTKITDVKEALERWEDEIRKHAEIIGAAMLNEATKKAISVTMAPPELATHLRLNADMYNTYAQMNWQVLSIVKLKLPSQPTTMWIDVVETIGSSVETTNNQCQ